MSIEKNTQPLEPKKERVSVLEKIRRRTGLLVGIVGLALVIFILESLLGSGASIFGGSDLNYAGVIDGKKIDRNEFVMRLDNQLNNYRQRNQGREADDATRSQAVESVWQQYIIDLVMKPEFSKVGIMIGEDELYESVVVNPAQSVIQNLTDPNTGRVNDQFSRPDGTLDPVKWRQAVQGVTGENEMAVRSMEEQVKSSRYFEKFRSLISKGLYVTNVEAKRKFDLEHTNMNVSFVGKKYDQINDSTVKVTDAEIEKYFNDHTYLYYNTETSRRLEYVTFNVLPTPTDVAAIEKEAIRVASEWKGKTTAEDSALMMLENENGQVMINSYDKKSMVVRDSSIFKASPGTVYGPYNEGAYFKVYKLEAINNIADSARVRHILVATADPQTQQAKRTKESAKREADSVLVLLRTNFANFDSLVKSYSDDQGSKTNGGDYGWFNEQSGFVEPFKNAGLMGVKGNISVVETSFGYHIIEVLDVSKTHHNSFRVAQVMKIIAPSEETTQTIFTKANQFAGEHNTSELFDKGVEKEKLTKRRADNIKEGDYQVPGLESPKELVRWAYSANLGDVSLFNFDDRFVVAKLSSINNKGTMNYDDVKSEVTDRVKRDKKANMLVAEYTSKIGAAKTIAEVSKSLNLEVIEQGMMSFANSMVDQFGQDTKLSGVVSGTKQGLLSKPVIGDMGVYVFVKNTVQTDPAPANYNITKDEINRGVAGRADYEIFNALKENAEIEFHKSRVE